MRKEEYKRRHGRRKRKKRSARKKKRVARAKRHVYAKYAPSFRRHRRYAAQPLRAPAEVLQHSKIEYHLLGELARQLMGPRYPPPNRLTQQGPPFLSYDPWARQRLFIQNEEKTRLASIQQEAQRGEDVEPGL